MRGSLDEACSAVAERLQTRRTEIEEAVFSRICEATFGHAGGEDPRYLVGLRSAVAAGVQLSLTGMQKGGYPPDFVPAEAREQARRAARAGVSLDTILRRYIAGHALIADYMVEEADRCGFSGDMAALQHHLRKTQTPLLERMMATIVEEYNDEVEWAGRSSEQRRAELVTRLLAGESPDPGDLVKLDYDFGGWHLGMILTGQPIAEALRRIRTAIGCRDLAVSPGEQMTWLWLGLRRKLTAPELKQLASVALPGISIVAGEPRKGIDGWRLTHKEAQAALAVARRRPGFTQCADVVLEAAVLQQETLVAALVETFLSPLDDMRYRGQTARDTLRAYFDAKRNVSSTAHKLGVVRNTVESRLREIEERLGRSLHSCAAQLEVALRVEALSDGAGEGAVPDVREPLTGRRSRIGEGRGDRHETEQSAQSTQPIMSGSTSHKLTPV